MSHTNQAERFEDIIVKIDGCTYRITYHAWDRYCQRIKTGHFHRLTRVIKRCATEPEVGAIIEPDPDCVTDFLIVTVLGKLTGRRRRRLQETQLV